MVVKLLAVCLVALLLLTLVACGTEEEVEQASPVASASLSTQAGGDVVRVLDVVVVIPEGSDVTVRMESIWSEDGLESRTGLRIERDTNRSDASWSSVLIDAATGAVVRDDVLPEDRAAIDDVLASLLVEAPDAARLPWPHATELAPGAGRESSGGLSFVRPARVTGLEVYLGIGDPGGPFIGLTNGRSGATARLDEQRRISSDVGHVLPEDLPLFKRWISAILVCGVGVECAE